jgi:hypothetical protein
MTMSLGRDPSELPAVPGFLGECRRRLWFTIMEMDLHLSLTCGLPCAIRQGEYTCKPPKGPERLRSAAHRKLPTRFRAPRPAHRKPFPSRPRAYPPCAHGSRRPHRPHPHPR